MPNGHIQFEESPFRLMLNVFTLLRISWGPLPPFIRFLFRGKIILITHWYNLMMIL